MKALNEAPADLRPYNALVIMRILPTKYSYPGTSPNSGPALIQTYSLFGAVRYVFWTSPLRTSNSFRAATNKMTRTESRDTTVLYVTDGGASVLCPSAQNLALRLKFSPSLMSNTKCPVISLNSGSCVISSSCSWNAILLFIISRRIEFIQRVLSLSLSMNSASSQVLGTRISYLCVLC